MKPHQPKKPRPLRLLFRLGLLVGIVAVASATLWVIRLPDVSRLAMENPRKTAFMKYREANGIHGRPIWVPLDRISPTLRHAVIVAEDANFYHHQGVDWAALWEAQKRNLEERRMYRGGSTITQQLAKNLYLEPSKTILRKLKELAITIRLEQSVSKSRLLEVYLNVVEWGRGVYGAEAAARHYFGKSASQLTIREASWLAAILPSPLKYDRQRGSEYIRERAEWISGFVENRLNQRSDNL